MQKVVIVGATGLVGQALVRDRSAAGDALVVLARDVRAAHKRFGDAVTVLGFSLEPGETRAAWERAVRGATVVNLAGAGVMDAAWTPARKRELRASRVEVTHAIALAMADASPEARGASVLVNASAVGIYGAREDDAIVAEDSPRGTDFLATLCSDWEAAADPARAAGIRVVHPRLGIVLGREGGALAELVRPFRLHVGGPIGNGKQWVSWVHERDVTRALALAVASEGMSGAYNVTAPSPVTMQALAETLAAVLHTHALARVPAFALKAALGSGRAGALLTGQRASSRRLVEAGHAFSFTDLKSALEDLVA
jgi:uncharacterized protein (TIGR01777 family)